MFLIDTSIWIRHFASGDNLNLSTLCDPDDRVLCLPVYQEILQGVREEAHFRRLKEILSYGIFVENPLKQMVYEEAVDLYRLSRQKGLTIRTAVDCLIAACAIRNNLEVLHTDRDFVNIAEISSLKQRAI